MGVRVENWEKRLFRPQIAWTTYLDPLFVKILCLIVSHYTLDANWLFNQWIPSGRTYVTGIWVGVRVENSEKRLFRPQMAWTTHLDPLSCLTIVSNSKSTYVRGQPVVQPMNSELWDQCYRHLSGCQSGKLEKTTFSSTNRMNDAPWSAFLSKYCVK